MKKVNDRTKKVNPSFTVDGITHEITSIKLFDNNDYFYGSICIDNMVWISIRVILNKNGEYILCLPSYKTKNNEYKNNCFFASKEIRESVLNHILEKAENEGII